MKRLLFAVLLAGSLIAARAQDNPEPRGPVVMPPAAPDATNAPAADSAAPAPQTASPDAAPSSTTPPNSTSPGSTLSAPPTGTGPALTPPAAGGQPNDIYDIRPPFFYIKSLAWLWLTLLALALVALLIGLFLWFKPLRALRTKSAYDLALERLEQARALLDENHPEPYAVSISETIRSYLSQRFHTPSTRQTTEEFLQQMVRDPASPLAGHRELLREFLESCDLVKFAHYQPTRDELEQVQQRAVTFVTATKPVENEVRPAAKPSAAPPVAAVHGGRQ
jgi:hypothetical protein